MLGGTAMDIHIKRKIYDESWRWYLYVHVPEIIEYLANENF